MSGYLPSQEPRVITRRQKIEAPMIDLNPHSINVIGTQPIVAVLIDCGTEVYRVLLPTDLQGYLARKLTEKLPGANTNE